MEGEILTSMDDIKAHLPVTSAPGMKSSYVFLPTPHIFILIHIAVFLSLQLESLR